MEKTGGALDRLNEQGRVNKNGSWFPSSETTIPAVIEWVVLAKDTSNGCLAGRDRSSARITWGPRTKSIESYC